MSLINKKNLSLNGISIGPEKSTFIVAEIGINHNGDINIAKKLIDEALNCGADAVKFQSFQLDLLFTSPTPESSDDERTSKNALLKACEPLVLSREDHYQLKDYSEKKGLLFFSTAGDIPSFELLKRLGVPLIKISSNDINNLPLLHAVAKSGIPTILSTGMAYLSEVDEAVRLFESYNHTDIALLHCVSNYPPKIEDLNLNNFITLNNCFEYPIGFSDHTTEIYFSVAAVAMGACIIERHFTLDHDMPGFDHKASLDPKQFKEMVKQIREIEKAKGRFKKGPVNAEKTSIENMRRSIVAKIDIPENTTITEDMLVLKRPGTGLSAKYFEFIIGRKSKKLIYKDTVILPSHLK